MLKRIMAMIMVMVMMTMFGSVTANAAKRDEAKSFILTAEKEQCYELGKDSDFCYAMINEFEIVDDEGDEIMTVSAMALAKAYAKYYGLTNKTMFTIVGPMILKEKAESGHDLGIQFGYVAFENGKLVMAHEFITTHEIDNQEIMAEVVSYL